MTHWDSENTTAPHTARELGQTDSAATALDALIEAVEAGRVSTDLISAALPEMWESVHALAAFDGSLDAAKALHDALLPGVNMDMSIRDGEGSVWVLDQKFKPYPAAWHTPARAWLLAILKALRADPAAGANAREGRDG